MNLEKKLNLAVQASVLAGEYLKNLQTIEVLSDNDKDVKLYADKNSEEIILSLLKQTNLPVVSEETSDIEIEGVKWVVDPLDGSLNRLRNIPFSSVSIALWDDFTPLLGVVYDFNNQDIYRGLVRGGAFLNNEKIKVSNINKKNKAVVFTGFSSKRLDYSKDSLLNFVEKIAEYKKARIIGSAALSLAYVAAGRGDAYEEENIMLWDVAAGLALVQFAGGGFKMKRVDKNKYDVIATNGKIEI